MIGWPSILLRVVDAAIIFTGLYHKCYYYYYYYDCDYFVDEKYIALILVRLLINFGEFDTL